MKKKINRISILFVIIVFGLLSSHFILSQDNSEVPIITANTAVLGELEGGYAVTRVVDGDTIIVNINNKDTVVRMIGIDTPESVHPDKSKNTEAGNEASAFTKELLTDEWVYLEYDEQRQDRYDRDLAYIYLDGKMVNKLLLEKGYAVIMSIPPNIAHAEEFEEIILN